MKDVSNLNKKNVEVFILNSMNNLETLLEYLELDFKGTIEGICEALFVLLKLYQQNKGRIDYLFHILEQIMEVESIEKLKILNEPIVVLDNKIKLLEVKQRFQMYDGYKQLKVLIERLEKKTIAESYDEKVKYLEYLIFQNKDCELVEKYLNSCSNLLERKNNDGDDIFSVVLKYYLNLDERKEEEIEYYFHIILVFLSSKYEKMISQNKKQYFEIIRNSKLGYKKHVINAIHLFQPDYQIPIEELEEKYHVSFGVSDAFMHEMYTLKMDNLRRKNFLYQDCITIDASDAKCLDDACYIEKNLDGTYTLYVHIIDIPAFIPYSSILNEEARDRVKTLYLKDNHISLYPSYISDQICSILPNNHRNVISYIFQLDSHFQVIEDSFDIVLGKIKSCYRLTYDEVDKNIKSTSDSRLHQQLVWLSLFATERRKKTLKKEEYRQFENFLNLEVHHESLKINDSMSANIVHESMVLVNYMVAKYFKELSLPYVYRKLILPSNDYIEIQVQKLKQLDAKLIEEKEFVRKLRESNIEALYSLEPKYHKGLKLECYSHSSSPARRYPDAYCQYLIHDLLIHNHLDDQNIYLWEYRTNKLVEYINKREKELEMFASQYNYLAYKNFIKKKVKSK